MEGRCHLCIDIKVHAQHLDVDARWATLNP